LYIWFQLANWRPLYFVSGSATASRYYFLVLVDITCALWMTTHMIKWVRVREVHVEYMVRGEADFRASYKHSLNYPFLTRKLPQWMAVCGVKVHFSVIDLIFFLAN
jgi:hypothetical protein